MLQEVKRAPKLYKTATVGVVDTTLLLYMALQRFKQGSLFSFSNEWASLERGLKEEVSLMALKRKSKREFVAGQAI